MTRARLTRLALRAYPEPLRADRGAEIADTLRDATAGAGRAAYLREIATLVVRGLQARARLTAASSPRRDVLDGICLAGGVLVSLAAASTLRFVARYDVAASPRFIALIAIYALTLARRDRLAGAGIVAYLVWSLVDLGPLRPIAPVQLWIVWALPIAYGATMMLAPRRGRRSPFELVLIAVPAAALVSSFALYLALVVGAAVSVGLLPRDIRPAIATGACALTIGIGMALFDHHNAPLAAAVLASAPTLIAAAAIRTRFVIGRASG